MKTPKDYDAVLGTGNNGTPVGSMVLGGIAGLKQKLAAPLEKDRKAAILDAKKYGQPGIELVMAALGDDSIEVRRAAYILLDKEPLTPAIEKALKNCDRFLLFECRHTIKGLTGKVTVSLDGRYVVNTDLGGEIIIRDSSTGDAIKCLVPLRRKCYSAIAITADNSKVICAAANDRISIWDVATEELLHSILPQPSATIKFILVNPNNKEFITGDREGRIRVWSLETGNLIKEIQAHKSIDHLSFIKNNKAVAIAYHYNRFATCNLATGKLSKMLEGFTDGLNSVNFVTNGVLVVGNGCNNSIKAWDTTTGKCIHTLSGHTAFVTAFLLSPDGETIVSASVDKTIRVWDVKTGECKIVLKGHEDAIFDLAMNPNSTIIASTSEGKDRSLRIWAIG